MSFMYSGTNNVAKAMQKNLRGKGNACIKAELGDKSKCDNCFGSEH